MECCTADNDPFEFSIALTFKSSDSNDVYMLYITQRQLYGNFFDFCPWVPTVLYLEKPYRLWSGHINKLV